MRLIDDDKIVVMHRFEVVHHRVGGLAGLFARKVSRVVLDPLADPSGFEHLEVKLGTLLETVVLDHAVFTLEICQPLIQLLFDGLDRTGELLFADDELIGGVDSGLFEISVFLTGEGVELIDRLDLIAKELHPDRKLVRVGGIDVDHFTVDPEVPDIEELIVAFVAHIYKLEQQRLLVILFADDKLLYDALVVFGAS